LEAPLKNKVGRPSVDPAYKIATRLWFKLISEATGMTDSQLDVTFGKSKNGKKRTPKNRSGIWGKYKEGLVCPKFKPDINGNPSIVEKVDKVLPGSADFMTMPFWLVLGNTNMDLSELKEVYLSLSEEVQELILMPELRPPKVTKFWRRPIKCAELFDALYEIGDIDAVTAVLALIKEGEATQNQELYLHGLNNWARFAELMQEDEVMGPVLPEMHAIVKKKFSGVYFAFSNGDYRELEAQHNIEQ
jgi:hypothetical protein